jgi:hypothetical protein
MTDFVEDSFLETGTVMTELVAKAREAKAAGKSRRDFFASTAKLAGATALGAAGISLMHPMAADAANADTKPTDTFQDIINIAATAEALAVTFYHQALKEPSSLPDVNSAANRNYFQAATVQEYEHYLYLLKLGAVPVTTTFYFPENMFTDETVFFPTAETLEGYFIAAYMAAAREFSGAVSSGITTANPFAIGLAVQILGVECEHRALLRVAQGVNPPNNLIGETALITSVGQAVAPLTPFLSGGSGFSTTPYMMPGKGAVNERSMPYGFSFFPKQKYF